MFLTEGQRNFRAAGNDGLGTFRPCVNQTAGGLNQIGCDFRSGSRRTDIFYIFDGRKYFCLGGSVRQEGVDIIFGQAFLKKAGLDCCDGSQEADSFDVRKFAADQLQQPNQK